MAKNTAPKDLFGKPVRHPRARYEETLERREKKTLPERAARVRWLAGVIPRGGLFAMSLETGLVFEEAKASFVYGNFVAVIVLAAAFIEHWFAAKLEARGYHKEVSLGLKAMIKCARRNKFVDSIILDKADRLRVIRNPFVHLKEIDHEHSVSQRMAASRNFGITALLENDAKEALIAMYGVAVHAFRR